MDPDSAVSEVQRRIELQSPEDLTFLLSNVRRAAVARLDEAFPPVEGSDVDELRTQIESLVNEYINRTFSLAAPNLSINGLPVDVQPYLSPPPGSSAGVAEPPPPTYEPFDARKRSAVADLITQEEKLLEDVAALKRSVPARVAAEHAERVRAGMRQDEEDLRRRVGEAGAALEEVALGVGELPRQRGVEAAFADAVQGLARLKRDMPAVVARMERARLAGEYVVARER